MSLRLEQKSMDVRVLVGENTAQTVVEGSISLPEGLPAIGKPLMAKASLHTVQAVAGDDQVVFEGTLDVAFYYASITEMEIPGETEDEAPEIVLEERLEKAAFTNVFPFSFVLDVPGAQAGMAVQSRVAVEGPRFEAHGDQKTVDIDTV